MATVKNNYDAVILSSGTSSLLYALNCAGRDMNVLLVDRMTEYKLEERDILLYPYELPIFGLTNSEYAEEFKARIGTKGFKGLFVETESPVSVVFGDNRFEYFGPYIKEEIAREFPDCQKEFISFIDEILKVEERLIFMTTHGWWDKVKFFLKDPFLASRLTRKDINFLYDRHRLPLKVRSVLDSIIFVFSGVKSRSFPALEAVRILASVLSGVAVPRDGTYSLRSELLDGISKSTDVENYTGELNIKKKNGKFNVGFEVGKNVISSKYIISDHDLMKGVFVKKFQEVKSEYSDNVLYPYSLHVKMPADFVTGCMGRWTIVIDADRSALLNYEDIYVVRLFMEGAFAALRITCFLPYGYFDIDNSIHREKARRMYENLKKLMPNIDSFGATLYPDFNSNNFGKELDQSLANMEQGDVVYTGLQKKLPSVPKRGRMILCGREQRPYLGFEGIMNMSLKELK